MISHFDRMGVVEVRDGPKTGPFPAEIEVLDLTEGPHPSAATMGAVPTEEIDLSGIEKVRRFPYGLRR